MDTINELVFLLPDYELEGFPRELAADKAARLLSGWVGLWHPSLLLGVGKIPRWHQASRLPTQLDAIVFVLPPISAQAISPNARQQIAAAGGLVVEPEASWRSFQARLFDLIPRVQTPPLAEHLASEFAALGYAYLQVQLLTRQLRYTSNLDITNFEEQVLKAAEAVAAGQEQSARDWLQACFDSLGQERDHYYSNDVHLLDLTLLAKTTLGASLQRQLEDPQPTTLISPANLLRQLAAQSPAAWEPLRQRLADGSLGLAGGLDHEGPLPLAPLESAIRALRRGPEAYQQLGLEPPRVFARLSFGLQADSAALLKRFGYQGALLLAFTGGRYPQASQPKISWEAHDGSRLPALACEPLDASDPSTFLALGWTVGEALDRQHVPTLVMAHWPGGGCEYFELLKIVTARTPALGRWCLVDQYFETTESPYHHQRLESDSFAYNWLSESQAPGDLLMATKRSHKLQARARSLLNIVNLIWQLQNMRDRPSWELDSQGDPTPPRYQAMPLAELSPPLHQLVQGLDELLEEPERAAERYYALRDQLARLAQQSLEELGRLLTSGRGQQTCRLVFNPRPVAVRSWVRTSADEALDEKQSWHHAAGQVGPERVTCVDLPSMGFVVAPVVARPPSAGDRFVLADAAGLLRNEFVEAQVDLGRGHIRSLHVPAKRGNRLSAMIAYRERSGAGTEYSEMVARSVEMLTCSNMSGIIRSQGALRWRGKPVGEFEIDYEIRRGSRIVAATITLSQLQPPADGNPWRSAFVLRLAWPTEAAILRVYQQGVRTTWSAVRTIAPEVIEIDEADYRTQILTGGLAFHSRQDFRFAETILAVAGQTSVRHRIGLAVDLPHPLATARQFIDKNYETTITTDAPASSGWLLAVDVKNLLVDLECPLHDERGNNVGLRIFVSEVAGQSTTGRVRLFRDVAEAHRVDFLGMRITRLTAADDCLTIAMRANEQTLVDILWRV